MNSTDQKRRKGKIAAISVVTLLVVGSIIAGVAIPLSQQKASLGKEKHKPGIDHQKKEDTKPETPKQPEDPKKPEDPKQGGSDTKKPNPPLNFKPNAVLHSARFNSLIFDVSNLNEKEHHGKKVEVKLVDKKTNQVKETKSITISKDTEQVTFSGLNENSEYTLEFEYEGQKVSSFDQKTEKMPRLFASVLSATNANIRLSSLKQFEGELDHVEVVIKNTSKPNEAPITINGKDFPVISGNGQINLQDKNLPLVPGTKYVAEFYLNENGKKTEIATPLNFETPQVNNVVYSYLAGKGSDKIILYGLKNEGKKVEIEYKPLGSNLDYTKVTSADVVNDGKVEVTFTNDLGFDNTYEFKVKYEGEPEYETFEQGKKDTASFKTLKAPTIKVETKDGLNIKLDNLGKNINQEELYIRYRDKEQAGAWTEKKVKDIPGFDKGQLDLSDLGQNKDYEAQLIYKKAGSNGTSSSTILDQVNFRTKQSFTFDLPKSTVTSTKAILSLKDGGLSKKKDGEAYPNVTLKYNKAGETLQKSVNLTHVSINNESYAVSTIDNLDQNTVYNFILETSQGEVLSHGTFKTGTASTSNKANDDQNTFEDKESNLIGIENRLFNGVFVTVKNTFGYLDVDGTLKYEPRAINIKYYPKDSPKDYLTETIFVTLNDLRNKKIFTKQIENLDNSPYVFEVSYVNGLNSEYHVNVVTKTFEINFNLPTVEFKNTEKQLIVKNLNSLEGKKLTLKYTDGSDEMMSVEKTVSNNQIEVNLDNLRPNTHYDVKIDVQSDDVEFKSSIAGETRKTFYGNENDDAKVTIESSFTTEDQKKTIWVKHEAKSTLTGTFDVYPVLQGFDEYKGKTVHVKIGTEDALNQVTDANYTNDAVKSFNGVVAEDGHLDSGNQWLRGLSKNTAYKIRVYEKAESADTLTKIAERDFTTPEIKTPHVQKLKIVGSNTNNPGFMVENIEEIRDLLTNNPNINFRAQMITDDRPYEEFTTVNTKTFTKGVKDLSFNHLKWTKKIGNYGSQGNTVRIRPLINANDQQFRDFFKHNGKYQIIMTLEKDNQEYVIATNSLDDILVPNQNPPRLVDSDTVNVLKNTKDSKGNYTSAVEYNLQNLEAYKGADGSSSTLKAYYIESNDILSQGDPTKWHLVGDVAIDGSNAAKVSFENLKPGTKYNFAVVDSNGTKIISRDNVKTSSVPKLRSKTLGDTIMKYNLADLKGSQAVLPEGKYKIKYSTDDSYSNESNEITINDQIDLATFEGNLEFVLTKGLTPNTTYKFKLVNENNEVVLGYEDFFKTNKSQSEETIVGNDYAVVKLINPTYSLREGSYSIAKRGKEADNEKTVLDVLRMQYSEDASFSTYKEYGVALSENESQLINLKFSHLTPGKTYHYRLVKGTIKAGIIKQNATDNGTPELTLDTATPIIQGQFTTYNINTNIEAKKEKATITFDNIPNVSAPNKVYLSYKKVDQTNVFDVNYDYQIVDGKIIFEIDHLKENTDYEYTVTKVDDNTKLISGNFKTDKDKKEVKYRTFSIDDTYRRVQLTNIDDYVGRNIRITLSDGKDKKSINNQVSTYDTVLTNDNDEFIWDFSDLPILKSYQYKIDLLDKDNNVEKTLASDTFDVVANYTSGGDQKVTTNVKALGNFELNNWYTVTTLQEVYADKDNWQDRVAKSLEQIGIYGTQVSANNAYGWHRLLVTGSKQVYFKKEADKLVYEYIFIDTANQTGQNAKLKGIKFEFRLVGNTIQVNILEAKEKEELIDRRRSISEFSYTELTKNLLYKSSGGLLNQGNGDIPGERYINVSGFKFKATTEKRGVRDFGVPSIVRYLNEEGTPALNEKIVSRGSNTAIAFIHLNNPQQEVEYGDFDDSSVFNYDVSYNKYLVTNNKVLPFNANFLISPSIYPNIGHSRYNTTETGFKYDSHLRSNFFNTLKQYGRIRFTGQDVSNRNWISFNSDDIILFEDEQNAYSTKYFKEFDLAKRLIWRDGNTLKGMRLTLNDASGGQGAALGMLDDVVYYLDDNENIDLKTLTWDEFVKNAKKHTTFKFMNPDSPGTAIAGISFVSKEKDLITTDETTFTNPQKQEASVLLESESQDGKQTRKLKFFNVPVGKYTVKVEYPIFFPTKDKQSFEPVTKEFVLGNGTKYYEIDLTDDLKYSTQYKITVNKDNQEYKVFTGVNPNIKGGFTIFASREVTNNTVGFLSAPNQGILDYPEVPERRPSVPHRLFDLPKGKSAAQQEVVNRIGSVLIGSSLLNNGHMRYKWSFKIEQPKGQHNRGREESHTSRVESILAAAVSDDNTKIVVMWIQIRLLYGGHDNVSFSVLDAYEHTLTSEEQANLQSVNLNKIWSDVENKKGKPGSLKKQNRIVSSTNATEADFTGNNAGKVAAFGFFIKDKEPAPAPAPTVPPTPSAPDTGSSVPNNGNSNNSQVGNNQPSTTGNTSATAGSNPPVPAQPNTTPSTK
ncbi:hypothetical protein [Ureaplasma canigenitalium]|uniref:hypothetical protein n=1 Tax=Ureaplasma canigenitalium TaxID=42092 RepID=UPI0004E286BA|nr:hypothetical protein [Ureaplasma canigenitalium]